MGAWLALRRCWDAGADCAITSSRVPHTIDPSIPYSQSDSRDPLGLLLHFGGLCGALLRLSGKWRTGIRCTERSALLYFTRPLPSTFSFSYCLYHLDLIPSVDLFTSFPFILTSSL